MRSATDITISADDEWSPLRTVIVGRPENSCFPNEPRCMIKKTMPEEHQSQFRPKNPFPAYILRRAQEELDLLVSILQKEGIRVYRPDNVQWMEHGGYSGAMPRDGLIVVGDRIIEACFAWRCRQQEVDLAFKNLFHEIGNDSAVKVVRAPDKPIPDTIYDDISDHTHSDQWAINNSRPAFDAADFMRFGKTLIGQFSHVTNVKGVEYLRSVIPDGYSVEILEVSDPHAMHIDATILPLRKRLLVYNPERVTEEALRSHGCLLDWEMHAYPFVPATHVNPPLYMTSPWIVLNALSLSESKVLIEAEDTNFAEWLRTLGMEPILCPFQHVNSIGGSFHCATVDLLRLK